MRTISRLLLGFLCMVSIYTVNAQNCNYYYPLMENTKMQYQTFNASDKLESIQEVLIKDITNKSNGTEATIVSKFYDKKNKLQNEGEYTVVCSGNEMSIDMSSMLDPAMMSGFEGMEVKIEANDIIFPSVLKVGDQLKDASMKMIVKAGPMTLADMNIVMKNRKVESKETITTPAGTFEAYKVSHDYELTSKAMGMTSVVKMKTIDYLVEDKGNIRSETYDEAGVLQSYTVLSKIF
jgi:hypothetical protein